MRSIVQKDDSICEVCRNPIFGTRHLHHIFEGTANRKKSDEDGMTCYLHPCCHRFIHERSPRSLLTLKQRGQRVWEQTYGDREAFIKRYGKSYL